MTILRNRCPFTRMGYMASARNPYFSYISNSKAQSCSCFNGPLCKATRARQLVRCNSMWWCLWASCIWIVSLFARIAFHNLVFVINVICKVKFVDTILCLWYPSQLMTNFPSLVFGWMLQLMGLHIVWRTSKWHATKNALPYSQHVWRLFQSWWHACLCEFA